jgi:hypothetical protein
MSFDPEAEQEVDFGRYWRLIGARWWVPIAGLVVGAVIGYLIALGSGNQVYKATANLYLGQPYTASGTQQLQSAQTNPSTVKTVAQAGSTIAAVAAKCKTKPGTFRGGISTQPIGGNISKNGQTAEVSLTVQAKKRKVAGCAANAIAAIVVDKTSGYADQKIANFRGEISVDERQISLIDKALQSGSLSSTDQLLLQLRLSTVEQDRLTTTQLLQQANLVEKPSVLTGAHASKVTARSRRNTVVVVALIGLVLGAIVALMWDGVAAGLARRRTA